MRRIVEEIPLGKLMRKPVASLNPKKYRDQTFNLFSIPAYDKGEPVKELGAEIGSSKKVLKKGDVLISRIVPHIRRVWIVDGTDQDKNIGSGEWIVFNSDRVIPEYLRYFLLSDVFHQQFMQTITGFGGSLMRANKKHTEKIRIPIYPFEEQKAIVDKLDRAQRLIDIDQKMLAKYDELIQSVSGYVWGSSYQSEGI